MDKEGGWIMVVTERISLGTRGKTDIIDITDDIAAKITSSGINSGIVTIFVAGSTAGLTTIEYEPGLVADFQDFWNRIIPDNIRYEHNERWNDGNGYSHVRASLLGGSLTIPFTNRKLTLGTWQQIILVDFDNRARQREVVLQVLGE
jgi:secondary thiamine-phosphate synthase enzyme